MQEWLTANFPAGPNGQVIVYQSGNTMTGFDPTQASDVFGAISTPPTYATLSALPLATTGNWQPIFDQWKADGKVS